MVYAGANASSFQAASRALLELADITITPERVRRATTRHGKERCEVSERLTKAFLGKDIPHQMHQGPADKAAPSLAVVMSDGGRYQRLERNEKPLQAESHWKESRIAVLLTMQSMAHESDPAPELPEFLQDVSIAKKLAEIGDIGGENPHPNSQGTHVEPPWQRPELLSKDVIASGKSWKEFGPTVASAAWYAGFFKAEQKVFVSDGSSAIEAMHGEWFSNFTSVLDLMHALSYSLAAARALHSEPDQAWSCYRQWATWIWQGKVDLVIEALRAHELLLGPPPAEAAEKDARAVIRRSRIYYQNHRDRMNYPEYRKQGYPLTSAIMESTVKQVNQRVKGSDKFWSTAGGEAVLRLRGDYLSDSRPMDSHWQHFQRSADGCRTYNLSS